MGYSSAVVTARSLLFASLGASALRNLICGRFTRLGAVDVRNRLKPVKSKVNVQVASAQRASVSNKLEPAVMTRATICRH
jgi:hypothetical protein